MGGLGALHAPWTLVLFMGGFFLAMSLQKWGLHRRIALTVAAAFGTGKSRLVQGFMVATGALSMWDSNTATTMIMFPIGMTVIQHLHKGDSGRVPLCPRC